MSKPPSQVTPGRRPPPSAAAAAGAERVLDALVADSARVGPRPPAGAPVAQAIAFEHAGQSWYPRFQFTADGALRADVDTLKASLPRDEDGGFRDAALWLYAPDHAFGGQTPAEAFAATPKHVVDVARSRRDGFDAAQD